MIIAWWPAASAPVPGPSPAPSPARPAARYAIVDGDVRRIVSEREFRTTVSSCIRIEVIHYPGETIVTNLCYR